MAISTPPGRGGIGIVRLSGPEAVPIAAPMFRLKRPLANAQARFAQIFDESAMPSPSSPDPGANVLSPNPNYVDEAMVTLFAAPNSYTGEDIVEIAAHGSPVILDLLLRQAIKRGARLAEPGEFTERAFLSGRLDLTQAEAVRDLIDAQTLYQARVAATQMGGALSRRIQPAKDSLITLIATIEAGIDFAEDDIDVIPNTDIVERIGRLQTALQPLESSFARGRIVHEGLTIAIVGRPNVGKSSLFNRLVERERAIVTATAGTTRDLVTERVSLGGVPVNLVDTAGLREAADEAEAIGVQKSKEALADADIVLVVFDATAKSFEEEGAMLAALEGRQVIAVFNKTDLRPAREEEMAETLQKAVTATNPIAVSARTGQGVAQLRERILSLARGPAALEETGMLTNLRQHQEVSAALRSLQAAAEAAMNSIPHEMVMLDLYSALRGLDALTGTTTSDDVLNQIFSTFCIGK